MDNIEDGWHNVVIPNLELHKCSISKISEGYCTKIYATLKSLIEGKPSEKYVLDCDVLRKSCCCC